MARDLEDTALLTRIEGADLAALEAKCHLAYLTKIRNKHMIAGPEQTRLNILMKQVTTTYAMKKGIPPKGNSMNKHKIWLKMGNEMGNSFHENTAELLMLTKHP